MNLHSYNLLSISSNINVANVETRGIEYSVYASCKGTQRKYATENNKTGSNQSQSRTANRLYKIKLSTKDTDGKSSIIVDGNPIEEATEFRHLGSVASANAGA